MSYRIEYFNLLHPTGNVMPGYDRKEESEVVKELNWLWSFPVDRVIIQDNDNGNIVYDKQSGDPDLRIFKPFGEKQPDERPFIFKTPLEI